MASRGEAIELDLESDGHVRPRGVPVAAGSVANGLAPAASRAAAASTVLPATAVEARNRQRQMQEQQQQAARGSGKGKRGSSATRSATASAGSGGGGVPAVPRPLTVPAATLGTRSIMSNLLPPGYRAPATSPYRASSAGSGAATAGAAGVASSSSSSFGAAGEEGPRSRASPRSAARQAAPGGSPAPGTLGLGPTANGAGADGSVRSGGGTGKGIGGGSSVGSRAAGKSNGWRGGLGDVAPLGYSYAGPSKPGRGDLGSGGIGFGGMGDGGVLSPNGRFLTANGFAPVVVAVVALLALMGSLAVPWVYANQEITVNGQVCSWVEMRGWSDFHCTRTRAPAACARFYAQFNCSTYNWRDALAAQHADASALKTVFDTTVVLLALALLLLMAVAIGFTVRCLVKEGDAGEAHQQWHFVAAAAAAFFVFLAVVFFAAAYSSAFREAFDNSRRAELVRTQGSPELFHTCDRGPCVSFWGAAGSSVKWGPAGWWLGVLGLCLTAPLVYWARRDGDPVGGDETDKAAILYRALV